MFDPKQLNPFIVVVYIFVISVVLYVSAHVVAEDQDVLYNNNMSTIKIWNSFQMIASVTFFYKGIVYKYNILL